jgi:hypothetical protein
VEAEAACGGGGNGPRRLQVEMEAKAAVGRGGGRGGMQRWKPSPDLLQRWRLRRRWRGAQAAMVDLNRASECEGEVGRE